MANILGCGGSKPSVTLTVAGKRLLELVSKAIPQVQGRFIILPDQLVMPTFTFMVPYLSNSSFVYLQLLLGQLAILPLQQQITLKKLLEASIPNIDSLVAAAGRSDWNR